MITPKGRLSLVPLVCIRLLLGDRPHAGPRESPLQLQGIDKRGKDVMTSV